MTRGLRSRRGALGLLVALSLLPALQALAGEDGAGPPAKPDPFSNLFGGPFSLISHTGKPVTNLDYAGKFLLIFFGYTSCPDVCPVGLTVMTQALDMLGPDADQIQPLFITVDPARDTPEKLAKYVQSFYPKLVGLSGSETQIEAVAKAYRVHRRKVLLNRDSASEYVIDHGSLTYLMGKDGKFLTVIPYTTTAGRMAETLKTYVK